MNLEIYDFSIALVIYFALDEKITISYIFFISCKNFINPGLNLTKTVEFPDLIDIFYFISCLSIDYREKNTRTPYSPRTRVFFAALC